MSDDIFIKHGLGSFQQPYNARTPANSQEPNIRNTQEPNIRNQQEPNIRNQQEPNIRNYQVPSTYNHRSPLTYDHRSPTTYNHRSPAITQATYQARQPGTYQHRSPSTYRHPLIYQHPTTYDHRSPAIANGQEPNIRNTQQPLIANSQQPTIKSAQQPNIRDGQEPNIRNAQQPTIKSGQEPNIRSSREPTTYSAQGRTPSTYNFRSPFTYNARTPQTYSATGTRTVPDAQVIDNTLKGRGSDMQLEGNAAAEAFIDVKVYYNTPANGGRLEVTCHGGGAPNSTNNSPTTPNDKVYWFNADHDVSIGGYTVKYTRTSVDKDDGGFTHTTIGTSATSVPTGGFGNALRLRYFCEAEADPGSDDEQEGKFDINLIFEHATLPTYTYTADWDIVASASSQGGE